MCLGGIFKKEKKHDESTWLRSDMFCKSHDLFLALSTGQFQGKRKELLILTLKEHQIQPTRLVYPCVCVCV